MTSILDWDDGPGDGQTPYHEQVRMAFYDIESLSNVFTLSIVELRRGSIDVFYLIDPSMEELYASGFASDAADPSFREAMIGRIRERNPYLGDWGVPDGGIRFHDLHTQASLMAFGSWFGVSDARNLYADPGTPDGRDHFPASMAPVTDMMDAFDPVRLHPYLVGFNSDSYDTTMLAIFFYEVYAAWEQRLSLSGRALHEPADPSDPSGPGLIDVLSMGLPDLEAPTASLMRKYNNTLFASYDSYMPAILSTPYPRGVADPDNLADSEARRIHRNFMRSGRHIDAKPLNEHNKYVSLKRLLGMAGFQILESSNLAEGVDVIDTVDQFLDLVAYNISDDLGLDWLFQQDAYSTQFDLKVGLMRTYPQTVLTREAYGRWRDEHPEGTEERQ